MIKSFYIHIAFVIIGMLYLLFGSRQLFFQFCHEMKLRHTVAAPETLHIESLADNFYKTIFFQLNTYKLINHCQLHTWDYRKPYEFLKSVVSTLIKGCSDLDSAFIKDLGSKHATNLNVAFQEKILNSGVSRNFFCFYIFFISLFFKDAIQSAAVDAYNNAYNYVRNWYFDGGNMATANDNSDNSGDNSGGRGGPGGPGSNPGGNSGSNNNASGSAKRKYKTEQSTRRKHLPIGKKPVIRQKASTSKARSYAASSSKSPSNIASSSKNHSSSKAPSSSNAPIIDVDKAAICQAEKADKVATDNFQASFVEINLQKANLEKTFSKYQGLVNGLKREYKQKPDIPLPDAASASLNQYLTTQKELVSKLRYVSLLKAKSTYMLDAVTNHLRFAKIETDKLEEQLQRYDFAKRDPFVLLTKETVSQVPPVTERSANISSTSYPPAPDATSDSAYPGQQPQIRRDAPKPYPSHSQDAAPVKKQFETEKEANEYLKYMPRHDTTFEDVDFDQVKVPCGIASLLGEYNNYCFPPGTYEPPPLNPDIPPTPAESNFATLLPSAQEQIPKSSKNKGKQPMYPRL